MGREKIINGDTIHTAKLFIYKGDDEMDRSFLVIKEPEGVYTFVGGAEDEEDESIEDTAIRELKEEVHLTEKSCPLINTGITHEFVHTDKNSPRYNKKGVLYAFMGKYDGSEQIIGQTEEEQLFPEWVSKDAITQLLTSSYPYLLSVFNRVYDIINMH